MFASVACCWMARRLANCVTFALQARCLKHGASVESSASFQLCKQVLARLPICTLLWSCPFHSSALYVQHVRCSMQASEQQHAEWNLASILGQ